MELIFRKVDPNDETELERFNALMDELSQRAFDNERLREKITAMNTRDDAYLMAAVDPLTGSLCGSMLALICDDFCGECAPFMVIENVVTAGAFRRRGVARAMFGEIEDWGRRRGVRYAILCSSNNRLEAHEFYAALDYKEIKGFKKFL